MLYIPEMTQRTLERSQEVISLSGDTKTPIRVSCYQRISLLIKVGANKPLDIAIVDETGGAPATLTRGKGTAIPTEICAKDSLGSADPTVTTLAVAFSL